MSNQLRKFRFLLVDDDPIFNFLNEKIVSESDCAASIVVHISAEEAFSYLTSLVAGHQEFPEIILLDLRMPSMNGIEFLESFQKLPEAATSNTTICILSSSLNEKDRLTALSFPRVKAFLSKPLTPELLRDFCNSI